MTEEKKKNEIAVVNNSQVMLGMINKAMENKDYDVAKLEALLRVKTEYEKEEARKEFVSAMNEFKKNPPEIFKDQHVKYQTSKGVTEYDHATLHQVSSIIGTELAKYGLSHRWKPEQNGTILRITCIITHVLGHSESVYMEAPADTSGGKNGIQGLGSTTSYLQRYTLLAVTGCAVKGMDNDANKIGEGMEEAVLNEWIMSIEASTNLDSLKKNFENAYIAAKKIDDKNAMSKLTDTKDAVKKKLSK